MGSLKIIKYDQEKADKQAFMIKNGKVLLEKLIASRLGKYNPIRGFSIQELRTATNNYDNRKLLKIGAGYHMYRGYLQDYEISIMKFDFNEFNNTHRNYDPCLNNVVFTSQMSHKKHFEVDRMLFGDSIPYPSFESVRYGTFKDHIGRSFQPHFEPFLLMHRIKIAMEKANAVTYLHIGFSRPIVFRDINSSNILFDEHNVPKLLNFSFSRFIPEGETQINEELVAGTPEHMAPEYLLTGDFNEKMDVFNFGALLLKLLTGKIISNLAHYEN